MPWTTKEVGGGGVCVGGGGMGGRENQGAGSSTSCDY